MRKDHITKMCTTFLRSNRIILQLHCSNHGCFCDVS